MMKKLMLIALGAIASASASADIYMDAAWAKKVCDAWNKSPILTTELLQTENEDGQGYSWINNNANRGYKLVQIYRTHCGPASKIQLRIEEKNGIAQCVEAGKPDKKVMNFKVDYLMHATDDNWACMGRGSFGCGAMGAMMSSKLKFQGPKLEAMKVMDPFETFLKIAGTVPGDVASCPAN
ncbi:MAG: Putative sterol carrier protein [uncultured Thiotrichaceae bacterium]|uniref:Sterol carrier protein n=1 Tax=uncultured Thiotrichaceae bacterium TaxID=298394 RepID=A0A6S6UJ51_9GAMM|nr:MAG: Putative sterol carrier protein [uncultured Thiotrichaceae bacterium]